MPAAKTAMKTDRRERDENSKALKKSVCLILPIALILGGCAGKDPSVDQSAQDGKESPVSIADGTTTDSSIETQTDASGSRVSGLPSIDRSRSSSYRIYLTGPDPVSAARLYRNYRMGQGDFMTLEQKAQSNPDIRKLYGAPFIYLWGEFLISPNDIDWKAFRQAADSPLTEYLSSFACSQENGPEFTAALEEIKKQDYVAEYQKNTVCSYLSQLLKREDFWDPSVFTQHSPAMTELLANLVY